MPLATEIADLLYHHDCVIVPRFGGFLGQYSPAELQRELKRILPPGKEITFNRELVRNDGLLADRIADSHQVAYNESLRIIEKHVSDWERELQVNGRLELTGLGVFLKDEEGQLLFQPDRKADFAVSSFGLRVTAAVPVKRQREEDQPVLAMRPEPLAIGQVEEGQEEKTSTARYWVAAATAALLITAGTLGLVKSDLNNAAQFGDLWPFGDTIPLYEEREAVLEQTIAEGPEELSVVDIPVGLNELDITSDEILRHPIRDKVRPVEPVSTYVEPTDVQGPYHVVIGCFSVKENATKLIAKYRKQGFQARVLDEHRGLFRVTLNSYAAKMEAVKELKAVRELGSQDAWLLVKR